MKKKKEQPDERVKTAHFPLKAYLITYFVLLVLAAGQWLIKNLYSQGEEMC